MEGKPNTRLLLRREVGALGPARPRRAAGPLPGLSGPLWAAPGARRPSRSHAGLPGSRRSFPRLSLPRRVFLAPPETLNSAGPLWTSPGLSSGSLALSGPAPKRWATRLRLGCSGLSQPECEIHDCVPCDASDCCQDRGELRGPETKTRLGTVCEVSLPRLGAERPAARKCEPTKTGASLRV